jgi:hypothetical protein
MTAAAKLMTIVHVREDNGSWAVMRGREESLGYFRIKVEAIQCALEQARRHTPCLVSIELADGRIEGELRFGLTDGVPALEAAPVSGADRSGNRC